MTTLSSPLDLAVPKNKTALMQHLQLLVGREEYRKWCGGFVSREKFPAFAEKMSRRYPILRNARGRSYDRKRGLAVMHLIAYPVDERIQWWLISDDGTGGLADFSSEDAKVSRDAMASDGHVSFGDYVLLYASKKEYRKHPMATSTASKGFYKEVSTWTWKLRAEVMKELRASVEECCANLEFGDAGTAHKQGRGLSGLLASIRRRPLFSGVRNQVHDLHIEATQLWRRYRQHWQKTQRASGSTDIAEFATPSIVGKNFPKMRRITVFDEPAIRMRDICNSNKPPLTAEHE